MRQIRKCTLKQVKYTSEMIKICQMQKYVSRGKIYKTLENKDGLHFAEKNFKHKRILYRTVFYR